MGVQKRGCMNAFKKNAARQVGPKVEKFFDKPVEEPEI
jgi:hypothetical protein